MRGVKKAKLLRVLVFAGLSFVTVMGHGQAPASVSAPAPAVAPAPAAAPVDTAKEIAAMQAKLDDWPQLGRYRADNAAGSYCDEGRASGVLWRLNYRWLGAGGWQRGLLSGQAVCEPRDQRADHAADGGAISSGCDRPASGGGGDSGGNE
jgi:hypothetical protein